MALGRDRLEPARGLRNATAEERGATTRRSVVTRSDTSTRERRATAGQHSGTTLEPSSVSDNRRDTVSGLRHAPAC
jgi:hypothetical protein